MRSIKEIRRENLRELAKKAGGLMAMSKLIGQGNHSYVYHIAGKTPIKEIGDSLARRIEKKLSLPINWLDYAHFEEKKETPSVDLLREFISSINNENQQLTK